MWVMLTPDGRRDYLTVALVPHPGHSAMSGALWLTLRTEHACTAAAAAARQHPTPICAPVVHQPPPCTPTPPHTPRAHPGPPRCRSPRALTRSTPSGCPRAAAPSQCRHRCPRLPRPGPPAGRGWTPQPPGLCGACKGRRTHGRVMIGEGDTGGPAVHNPCLPPPLCFQAIHYDGLWLHWPWPIPLNLPPPHRPHLNMLSR